MTGALWRQPDRRRIFTSVMARGDHRRPRAGNGEVWARNACPGPSPVTSTACVPSIRASGTNAATGIAGRDSMASYTTHRRQRISQRRKVLDTDRPLSRSLFPSMTPPIDGNRHPTGSGSAPVADGSRSAAPISTRLRAYQLNSKTPRRGRAEPARSGTMPHGELRPRRTLYVIQLSPSDGYRHPVCLNPAD